MLKALIPRPIKRSLRQMHRNHVMHQAVVIVRSRLSHNQNLPPALLERLIYGWGNEGWSAKTALLNAILEECKDRPRSILECGSGLTTVLFAVISSQTGGNFRSLEHQAQWHQIVCRRLREFGLADGCVSHTPLMNHGEFDWYDTSIRVPATETYDLVLCDGPPGSTRGGRYGLLPQMLQRLRPGARIIMDDIARADEARIIQRWLAEHGDRIRLAEQHESYAILSVI